MGQTLLSIILMFSFLVEPVGDGFFYVLNIEANNKSVFDFSIHVDGGIEGIFVIFGNELYVFKIMNIQRKDTVLKNEIVFSIKIKTIEKTISFEENWRVATNSTQKLIKGKWVHVGKVTFFAKYFHMEQNFNDSGKLNGSSYVRTRDQTKEISMCMYKNGVWQPELSRGELTWCWRNEP